MTSSKGASVRQRHGRIRVLRIGIRKRGGSVVLGFHRRQAGPREFLRLQMRFGTDNGGLGGVEIRRIGARRARRLGGGDGLPRIAHLLHGRAGTSGEACNTNKYSE